MEGVWSAHWQGVRLRVVDMSTGRSLHVEEDLGPDRVGRVWLRFDCVTPRPIWRRDPTGRDEIHPLDERGDFVAEAIELLRREGSNLIVRGGGVEATDDSPAMDHSSDPATRAIAAVAATSDAVLREAEIALRNRPVELDELDLESLRARRSEKWHTYPADVLPAWVAEMDFPIAAPIRAELERFTRSSDVGYPLAPDETGLADAFCERMAERFDWQIRPGEVEILSEVVQGLYLALEAFSAPGDGVVVQTPIYPPFLGSIRDTGRRLIENRMRVGPGGRLDFELDALAGQIDRDTRVFLFCNPHNPSGRVYARAELERVAEVAIRHDLVVVSDEIHADLLFDGRRHVPLASLGPEIARRTLTLSSASKAFNIPGLRCAVAHVGDPALARRLSRALPRHVRGGIGLFGLYATIAAWRYAQPWLDDVVAYLEANRDFVANALADRIPELRIAAPEATFLAWLDCGALEIEGSPAAHFLRHGRVALSDGRLFGEGWEPYVRLNFATSRPILTDVVDRMAKALGR